MSIQQQPNTVIVHTADGTNVLGTVGLFFSAIGWLTCGLLCIPGAAFSFLGLFSKKPKGTALAGLIIGFPGVLFFAFIGMGMLAGVLGLGAAATATVGVANIAAHEAAQRAEQDRLNPPPLAVESIDENAEILSEDVGRETDILPTEPMPESSADIRPSPDIAIADIDPVQNADPLVQPEPLSEPDPIVEPEEESDAVTHVFTDPTGKFRIEAEVIDVKNGWVKLKRTDNGKEVPVKIEKLSSADQRWLAKHHPE